jgi:hypothetical protein
LPHHQRGRDYHPHHDRRDHDNPHNELDPHPHHDDADHDNDDACNHSDQYGYYHYAKRGRWAQRRIWRWRRATERR